MRCSGSHSRTYVQQIPIQLAIIKRAERDLHTGWFPNHVPWEFEEWFKAIPGCMGISGRKILIPCPHPQIGQRHFVDGHQLVFVVIQFVHLLLPRIEVFQPPQHLPLFATVPFQFPVFGITFAECPIHLGAQLQQLGVGQSLHGFALDATDLGTHSVQAQGTDMAIQCAVQRIPPILQVLPAFVIPLAGPSLAFSRTVGPTLERIAALLQDRPSFGNF